MQVLVKTQVLRCTWWVCSNADEPQFSTALLWKNWTELDSVHRAKISSLLSPYPLPSLRLHLLTSSSIKKICFQRTLAVKKDRGLAASELQSSLQNPATQVAALQASPFTSPTVYLIFQTGRSVFKWEKMEKGSSFSMHIYSSSFKCCQVS